MTFGMPAEWEDFSTRHAGFLERLPRLKEALRVAFVRTAETSEPLDRLIFFSGRLCAEEFSEILLLCANGYGVGALKLVRGMFERTVTAWYIHDNPAQTDDFFDFFWVSQYRLLKAIQESFGPSILSEEKVAEVEANYNRVRERFRIADCKKCGTTRLNHTWSKLDFISMARAAGPAGQLIVPAYSIPTQQAHSTVGAILARLKADGDGLEFDWGPQREKADDALISAHNLILSNLELQKEHFGLTALDELLKECLADFMAAWDKGAESRTEP